MRQVTFIYPQEANRYIDNIVKKLGKICHSPQHNLYKRKKDRKCRATLEKQLQLAKESDENSVKHNTIVSIVRLHARCMSPIKNDLFMQYTDFI
jgi:hypothetical protein